MPKHLSRLTAQDQVLTANDLFDPENRPHGKVMALAETKSLVDHSTQAHIFATKAELDAFVAEQSALSVDERKVKVGDNLYITDTGVPDYWWMGEAPWVSELETGVVKVEVDSTVNASSSNPVSGKAVSKALCGALCPTNVAIGYGSCSTGNCSTAVGYGATASGTGVAVGFGSWAEGAGVAVGCGAESTCNGVAIGRGAKTNYGGVHIAGGGYVSSCILWDAQRALGEKWCPGASLSGGDRLSTVGALSISSEGTCDVSGNIMTFGTYVAAFNKSYGWGDASDKSGLFFRSYFDGEVTCGIIPVCTLKALADGTLGSGGGFDPNVSAVAIGLDAVACSGKAIAIGESAYSTGGVAIGHRANAPADSVTIGGPNSCGDIAGSVACSVVVGAGAWGHCWSVAVGYDAGAGTSGAAVGSKAYASDAAVAVGADASGASTFTVAVGPCARATACDGQGAIAIGPLLFTDETTAIAIGTECGGLPLHNATIRVDYNGNLTVGGKPVGGGGDSGVEVWTGTVNAGGPEEFVGSKNLGTDDLPKYARWHNRGEDIHAVSGFSNETDTHWNHRFIIPWELARTNDSTYMATNVKWQGSRNLIGGMDCDADTTFVQPLMPANTGATSSIFPYAIPAFEESPVYWSGTIMYNDSLNSDGATYGNYAKSVTVPWSAMTAGLPGAGGSYFLTFNPARQDQSCVGADKYLNVAVVSSDGGGGTIGLMTQMYASNLEARIKTLEDKLAAVGA